MTQIIFSNQSLRLQLARTRKYLNIGRSMSSDERMRKTNLVNKFNVTRKKNQNFRSIVDESDLKKKYN